MHHLLGSGASDYLKNAPERHVFKRRRRPAKPAGKPSFRELVSSISQLLYNPLILFFMDGGGLNG